MNQTHFHNTIELKGTELIEANTDCKLQEQQIFEFFDFNFLGEFTTEEVWIALGWKDTVPLTSARRGITNLTKQGKLIKTTTKVIGMYGKPIYKWKRFLEKGQQKMF